ncbi:hypothetical protein TCAL_04944 [Tigriopus californicus]|uniref:Uncharacterized protein n=1 Tax=Tigriopus californicus TaxID=6832 RepID=A0A553PBD2_TIGCA|nr:uncharacterized protein LOC131893610 isoform X2 [Tigriopus californicus]TRY75001.1 hypothetical protein TCAL_04944 [Tigriopus californicus]|eukprot:TCALIF_04944-PA protein Name:"Protein of unknown function" AED:0.21 eAED:0.21 QI:442/1/0.66/1/0.5/0.33/3/0/252
MAFPAKRTPSYWALILFFIMVLLLPESSQLKDTRLTKRESQNGNTYESPQTSAKERLDNQIFYLINEIPKKIASAITVVEDGRAKTRLKRITQGWSIVFASWKDIYSIYLFNNRTLSTVTTSDLYIYGFLGSYGIGFGYPLLLGLPKANLPCDSHSFSTLLDRYGLSYGVSAFMPYQSQSESLSLSSRIAEFDLLVRTQISCILVEEGQYVEAAEVNWALEELITAMNLRLALEDVSAEPIIETTAPQTWLY